MRFFKYLIYFLFLSSSVYADYFYQNNTAGKQVYKSSTIQGLLSSKTSAENFASNKLPLRYDGGQPPYSSGKLPLVVLLGMITVELFILLLLH